MGKNRKKAKTQSAAKQPRSDEDEELDDSEQEYDDMDMQKLIASAKEADKDGDTRNETMRMMAEEEDDSGEEEEDDEEEDNTSAPPAKKENKELLESTLKDLKEKGQQPWLERLDVTAGRPIVLDDPDDDLRRELQFYNQALASVKAARTALDELDVKHMRPDDYFAEMLKSDKHMAKVKDKLIVEQQRMKAFEQRKKAQDSKKYAKQVASERFKEKSAQKKANLEAIQQWQKKKASRGGITDENADKELESMLSSARASKTDAAPKRKRQAKNKKYGYGGPKRAQKKNDSKSAADTRDFSMKRNRSLPPGLSKAMSSGAGKNRPGKSRRAAKRGRG